MNTHPHSQREEGRVQQGKKRPTPSPARQTPNPAAKCPASGAQNGIIWALKGLGRGGPRSPALSLLAPLHACSFPRATTHSSGTSTSWPPHWSLDFTSTSSHKGFLGLTTVTPTLLHIACSRHFWELWRPLTVMHLSQLYATTMWVTCCKILLCWPP